MNQNHESSFCPDVWKLTRYLLLCLVTFSFSKNCFAEDDLNGKYRFIALSGVQKIDIRIVMGGSYGEKNGYLKRILKQKVELEARKANIQILETEDVGDSSNPHVLITVDAEEYTDGKVVETVSFGFHREFIITSALYNGEIIRFKGPVWELSMFGSTSRQIFDSNTKEMVDNLLTEFLNDFLKANPKKPNADDSALPEGKGTSKG
jgi:hypothetical protein